MENWSWLGANIWPGLEFNGNWWPDHEHLRRQNGVDLYDSLVLGRCLIGRLIIVVYWWYTGDF